ncbi:MAG: hypothetical protein QF858_01765 [Candidatus Pacebacteria bacterium]|jgi:UDPglucose 6-dehydrogenase|nr:hypothetical protein [bacterium]MDP6527590.1 hypothetical protein [Candidatus Paceibacterota bacterium]MDP6659555.1 hypothetical protein [Candidatus Paceibacterota bacterium]|tara:strand:- start:59055 stop:59894 length:840 start_codon:yes stop_codon:yes gene_type:complete
MKIGFIGQGYIGKNYADDFENRGYDVVRYALEEPYNGNKEKIKDCDIVFVAVPTPTTPKGFDSSIIEDALTLVGEGKIAVIKSTILPGTTKDLQEKHKDILLLCSPEFLSEATAAHDAASPFSNIVGIPEGSHKYKEAADKVHSVLAEAPFVLTCSSVEAEIIKYTHNGSGYTQIMFFNIMYDLANKLGGDWEQIEKAVKADPMICNRYASPVHKTGRGAGGHCFIKDIAALRELYGETIPEDNKGFEVLESMEEKNKKLLKDSDKDLDLLEGVYGKDI